MHSSVAESSFYCWLQFFSGKTGVSLFKKKKIAFQSVLLLFVRYDVLKGVVYVFIVSLFFY